ncbi:MAG: AAA family ATPase, partial [Rhizobiales bacterium]|nr:AAA family ATPase [Hyphomicrobiales bacterium]
MSKQNNILITGTDTDIGKTVFAAGLTAALNAYYWKPIQAGYADGTDSETVKQYAAIDDARILPESYMLKIPASPHYSAEMENVEIQLDQLVIPRLP